MVTSANNTNLFLISPYAANTRTTNATVQLTPEVWKLSKCHGCASLFDKTNEKLYVFVRKEDDRWEKENKDLAVKQFSCLLARRPLLKKENITILCESDKVHDVPEWIKELQH